MRVTRAAAAVVLAVVLLLLGAVQEAQGFVGFGSGVPGGFISYMWWIYLGAMAVGVYKKKLVRYKERRRILLAAEEERQKLKEAAGEVPIQEEEIYYNPYSRYDTPFIPHGGSRSLNDLPDEDQHEDDLERLLLTLATHLDKSGCSLKLLCHLREKPPQARSLEEDGLVHLFANGTAGVSCTQEFPSCAMGKEQLRSMFAITTALIGSALHLIPSWL
ncbi:hypothetical protein O3P69_015758 [Scylla paramamosain]|uniref:Uncharacterized protein n=1 Tax=Scylla paramamosain TaxID=85552 RepID=A0AAW0T7G4_SCYPA